MASASSSSAAGGSADQRIEIDVEDERRSGHSATAEALDEEMTGDATPAGEGTETPHSTNTGEPQDESDLAASFYQSNSSKRRQSGSRLADSNTIVVNDDDDDLMEPELPGREERVSGKVSTSSSAWSCWLTASCHAGNFSCTH